TPQSTASVGAAYSFIPAATDADVGATLTFGSANAPPWATFDSATGELRGTPGPGDVGSYPDIVIYVSDGYFTQPLLPFTITVVQPNRAPAISGVPAGSVAAGAPYSFTPAAIDPDTGTTLTFSINTTPAWATFDAATGRLQGTPVTANAGT